MRARWPVAPLRGLRVLAVLVLAMQGACSLILSRDGLTGTQADGGADGSSADSGADGDARAGVDAGEEAAARAVQCGSTPCPLPESVCCFNLADAGGTQCTTSAMCTSGEGYQFVCDDDDDCKAYDAGGNCCVTYESETLGGSRCQSEPCAPEDQLCDPSPEAPSVCKSSLVCAALSDPPTGYYGCVQPP